MTAVVRWQWAAMWPVEGLPWFRAPEVVVLMRPSTSWPPDPWPCPPLPPPDATLVLTVWAAGAAALGAACAAFGLPWWATVGILGGYSVTTAAGLEARHGD